MTFTALFPSAREAVRAERACREAGLQAAVVPAPGDASSDCGMALRLDAADRERFEAAMVENVIKVTIYEG